MRSFEEALASPLAELVVADVQIQLPPEDIQQWNIPDTDALALTSAGLPVIDVPRLFPNPNPGTTTASWGEYQGYHLGTFRILDVVLDEETKQVFGVPMAGYEYASSCFINSSAAAYVECAWRYYWLVKLVDPKDFPVGTTPDYYDLLCSFVDKVMELDPGVERDPRRYIWAGVLDV